MHDSAHGVVPTHAIFQSPLPVELEFVEKEKPSDYYLFPGTAKLGEKIRVWQVQTKTFPEIDPGLVSSHERFVHTPDAEIISGGINGKGPRSVAIGRHGNFLLWGFYAQPKHLTPSARNAFINSVAYIAKFDGQKPGPVQSIPGREDFVRGVYWLRSISDEYIDGMVKEYLEQIKENPPPEEVAERIGDDPKAYFRSMYASYAKNRLESIPQAVRDQCDDDTKQLIAYYDQNIEYLRRNESGVYEVDPNVQQLQISNRSLDLIDACIKLLDESSRAEMAMAVLHQYTEATFDEPRQWKNWWESNKDNLRYDPQQEIFVARPRR